ncbi:MAG: efflux RND transporter periplasmic adaptor subunit [Deltaproteobacteria bacterium]|nr:efflux RND transporter periplasmic adaptor subunit [Deltaproteobacteria bacterium]
MTRFFLPCLGLALALGLCTGCSPDTPEVSAGPNGGPDRPTPVVVARPEERSLDHAFLEREATLNPIAYARISTRREGFVRRRLVEEGDIVHEGDPLAELDPTDRELRLAELRASLKRAEATRVEQARARNRAEKLFARHVASESELEDQRSSLDRARAEVEEVRARVKQAEQALAELHILAPMDAVVSGRFIEEGEYLERGDPVAELKRIDSIIAICTISERDLTAVQEGAPARVHVTAFPDRSFEGLVWRIIPNASVESRSFPVWVLLPNPEFLLKPGMSARVTFVRRLERALLIPKDAVLEDETGAYVFVIADDRAERRSVELGPAIADSWSVRSGLSTRDLVVVAGNEDLESGEATQIVELPPPGPPTLPTSLEASRGDASGS